MLITFIATISALFVYTESEFVNTSKKQMAEGYEWALLDSCRPAETSPAVKLDNNLVCFALEKSDEQ